MSSQTSPAAGPHSRTAAYERPLVAVDLALFSVHAPSEPGRDSPRVLLGKVAPGRDHPFAGCWALIGGLVQRDETTAETARRVLRSEAGIENVYVEQLKTFDALGRDPRGRVISVAYYGLIYEREVQVSPGGAAAEVAWFDVDRVPLPLAFDHEEMVVAAVARLRARVQYSNVAFQLLPPQFTVSELRVVYEAILGRKLDPANFYRRMLTLDVIEDIGETVTDVPHRPAKLYRFRGPMPGTR